jgi:hypothetical protein
MNDAIFIEQAGATIVSRGGRLYVRCRGEYDEIGTGVRAIVGSGHGFAITSDAVGVCARKHVEVIITDATQSFVTIYGSYAAGNASRAGLAARMLQFAALTEPRRKLAIAKDIVRRKIVAEGHERGMGCVFLDGLGACKSVAGVRHVEAKSAQEWWRRWKEFELCFAKEFKPPAQWRSFRTRYIGRAQGKSGELPRQFTARFAETPLQALHNFARRNCSGKNYTGRCRKGAGFMFWVFARWKEARKVFSGLGRGRSIQAGARDRGFRLCRR